MSAPAPAPVRRGTIVGVTLALFLVWSHTFLAFELLLAPRSGPAPMGWLDLVVARMVPVGLICGAWCFGLKRRASFDLLRRRSRRLLLCGLLTAAAYNSFLYLGMHLKVSGPVASLLTTLAPLYLVAIGALFLGEPLTRRKVAGVVLGLLGVVLIATAGRAGAAASPGAVALAALAPLSWAVYTALTKPVAREQAPIVWTYLVLFVGALPLLPLVPWHGGPAVLGLDAKGWAMLAYLVLLGSVAGNGVWTWLLRHLPASTVGLTIFLNPPLTTAGKWVLSTGWPETFAFTISGQEALGGALSLLGVYAASGAPLRRARRVAAPPPPA